jgi:peptidoglycan-associated lipoprotein
MGSSCGKKPLPPTEQPNTTITDNKPPAEKPPDNPPPVKPPLAESQLATVYFDFDQFNLRSDARSSLDANFRLLQEYPAAIVKIEGHCDERGTVEYNLALGEKRARAAMDYLVSLGIASNRVSIVSFGKERPASMGSNEEAWARNRRAEFRVISQ